MDQPNPIAVLFRITRALLTTSPPKPSGSTVVDHNALTPVLAALGEGGLPALGEWEQQVDDYVDGLASVSPDALSKPEALAFWLNLYNAGAIKLAIETFHGGEASVLRIPGGFSRGLVELAGETLSLDAIEHAKLRRLRDPRVHGALVCGSLSCPTVRAEPYVGARIDDQLDDQMRSFLANGGAIADNGRVLLSRVFLWYGADFVRPNRMPTFVPTSRSRTLRALGPWLSPEIDSTATVEFQPYDWSLACSIG